MSSFTDALILIDNEDGKTFTVGGDFTYYIGELPSQVFRVIRKGFVTDLASKPALLRRTGKYNKAAVLHDGLYDKPYVISYGVMKPLSRKECDEIFLEAMLVLNTRRFVAYAYYAFVRALGWRHWRHG